MTVEDLRGVQFVVESVELPFVAVEVRDLRCDHRCHRVNGKLNSEEDSFERGHRRRVLTSVALFSGEMSANHCRSSDS